MRIVSPNSAAISCPLELLCAEALLKLALKARGVTYQIVANRIGVSEQTIKRLFKEKDCSLSRLNDVCEAIDISLYDLLDVAREFSESMTSLNDDQQIWLAMNPSHFHFLFFLTSGYALPDIQEKYQLSEATLFRYLRDLDDRTLLNCPPKISFG